MPTYEYSCPACKKSYETREGFDAPNTHVCQKCGKATAKRILHAPRVVFKGSGFYATDSRSGASAHLDSEKPESGSESPEPAKKDAPKTSAKSDSKNSPKSTGKAEPAAAS